LEALGRPEPSLSFEFYPPKDPAARLALLRRAGALDRFAPDFVSVTYGAGGAGPAGQTASFEVLAALAGATGAARVAHLTLVGQRREELEQAVGRLAAAGAEAFMALRGDPADGPAGVWSQTPGGLRYAVELVELIRGLTALPIGVAAFPQGHPAAPDLARDAAVLAAKQAAGASFALTQVVYQAEAYFKLAERARAAGASLPLVPGIMPLAATSKLAKLELFAGAPLPAALVRAAARAASPGEVDRVGVQWSVQLARDLLAGGAPGVHFYTLNSSPAPEAVCRQLGFGGSAGRAEGRKSADNA
jgi:methylenetetrahydrofolate reductase (NADPH)